MFATTCVLATSTCAGARAPPAFGSAAERDAPPRRNPRSLRKVFVGANVLRHVERANSHVSFGFESRRPYFASPQCTAKAPKEVKDPEESKLEMLLSKSHKMLADSPVKIEQADFKKEAVEMYGRVQVAAEEWKRRDRPAAVLMCEKAIAAWAHELEDWEGEAASLNRQGVISQQLGDLEGALNAYEHALHVQVEKLPSDVAAVAQSFFNLGTVCDYLGQDSRALNWYRQCREMRERTLGLEHPLVVAVDINLGHFYARRNRVAEAGQHWQEALATLLRIKSPSDPEIAITRFNLGPIYEAAGDPDMALKMCDGALETWGRDLDADWPSYVACLTRMGEIENRRKRPKEAAGYLKRALAEVEKRIPNRGDEDRLAMEFLTARALKEAGETEEALKLFETALKEAEGAKLGGGSGNPLFEIIVNGVASARREAGDTKGAEELAAKYPH